MAAKLTLGIMGSWWRDRHRPKPSVAGSGEIPLPGMTSWLGAGLRYPLAPSPPRGNLDEPSTEDELAGAPVLQRGGQELKSTRGNLSGQRVNGLWCPLPCPAYVSAGPRFALRLHTPPRWASGGLGRSTLWASHLVTWPAGRVTAFRAAGWGP